MFKKQQLINLTEGPDFFEEDPMDEKNGLEESMCYCYLT